MTNKDSPHARTPKRPGYSSIGPVVHGGKGTRGQEPVPSEEYPGLEKQKLAQQIKQWGKQLGFDSVRITDINLSAYKAYYANWLKNHYCADMHYMQRNKDKRLHPERLVPHTQRIICVSMQYLTNRSNTHISQHALGRDYHKLMRKKLQNLADMINDSLNSRLYEPEYPSIKYRAFVDSAPVLETALAEKAGIGWIGKHTNIVNKNGSWLFLGELFTNLPLPTDSTIPKHCGTCTACMKACPTGAIIAPYQLDARKCIAYLTTEHSGSIPVAMRPLMGLNIYGCDICQNACPWNKNAKSSPIFFAREVWQKSDIIDWFLWSPSEFLTHTEGSTIRRIGHEKWLRNIAICLGNMPKSAKIRAALKQRLSHPSPVVREHVAWALKQQEQ